MDFRIAPQLSKYKSLFFSYENTKKKTKIVWKMDDVMYPVHEGNGQWTTERPDDGYTKSNHKTTTTTTKFNDKETKWEIEEIFQLNNFGLKRETIYVLYMMYKTDHHQ